MMQPGKQTVRALTGDNAVDDKLTVAAEIVAIDVSDLKDIALHLVQATYDAAATFTLSIQYTLDGTYWAVHTTKAESDFAAADGDVEIVKLSNGATAPMPIAAKAVRVVLSALAGGAPVISAKAIGMKGASA